MLKGEIQMFSWIAENLATILICIVLLILVGTILFVLVRNRRRGKTSCGCSCTNCPMSGSCHPKK